MTHATNQAFVAPLETQDAPEAAQPILKKLKDKFGESLGIFHTMAYQPDVLEGVTKIDAGLTNDLPAKYRELAYFKSSQLNECSYCSHYHSQAAKKVGVSDEQLAAIGEYESSDAFDNKEKAVLRFSEELTTRADVRPATAEKLNEFLNDTQLVTLSATVALANFTNRFNHGLGIQLP